MQEVRVVVEAEVRPTEDPEKVKQAILNIIDPDIVRIEDLGQSKIMIAESSSLRSLEKLHRLLRVERILDAARGAMKKGLSTNKLIFHLHKQAAYRGRLSFVSGDHESPLGSIRVIIEHDNPREVLDWLAPPTARGRPVFEKSMPE